MNKNHFIRIFKILPIVSLLFSSEVADVPISAYSLDGVPTELSDPNYVLNTTNENFNSSESTFSKTENDIQLLTLDRDETTYQFTNCGATGRYGPTIGQVTSAYSGTTLDGLVTSSNGIQLFTIPSTGTYTIEVWGGQGGENSEGYGARMKGDFHLSSGTVLKILIGQRGSRDRYAMSGGGGTFIATSDNIPLIIAGGGGGTGWSSSTRHETTDGVTNQDGQPGWRNGSLNNQGSNGNGGTNVNPWSHGGGGGAGFYGDGAASNDARGGTPVKPLAFINGGVGGLTPSNYFGPNGEQGGFGGGSAGGWGGAGGGGGYSGGGSDRNTQWSGGGGSYNSGTDQDNSSGVRLGHGMAIITAPTQSNNVPVASTQSVTGNEDETQTITLMGSDADGDALTYNLESGPSHGTAIQDYSSLLSFDGVNDEIMISGGNFISGNESRSISVWADGSYGNIVSLGHGWTSNARFSILINQRRVYIIGQWNDWATNYYLPENQMTHLVVTHDGNTLKLYADGVLQQQTSKSYNTNANMPIMIGTNTDDRNDEYFNGTIDDVIITRDVITSNEVTSIYNGNNITLDNLVGMYDFNEGSGNVVYDLSMNMNDGNITGANWINEGTANIITYTPNQNYNGTDSFTYTVSDGEATSEAATVNITLTSVNDLPIITSSPTLDALEESQYNYSINVNDVDGDAITITAQTRPDWLSIINNNTNSLDFDGINDYVEISNTSQLEPGSQVTVSTWAYMDNWSSANDSRILSNTQSGGFALAIDVSWNQDKLGFYINIDGTYLHPDIALSSLSSGWHHITGTYDNRYAKLYIDGILVDVVDNGSNNDINYGSDINLFIGAEPIDANNSTSLYFNGSVNEVSIFDAALNLSEIHANMNNGLTGDENGLVGYWNFNEGSGSILTDQSSNGNDGTINGASWSTDVAYSSYVLTGTPSPSDGGLHNVVLNIDDGNGGIATQSFSIGVAVTHLDITGESGFRILSSPVSGAIFGDLLEELWTQGSDGSDHEGADPNVWTYDNGWVPVADLNNDVLSAGQGFVVYVFADTDFDGDDDLPVTIDIDGAINETAVSVTANPSQWNLVGNPYGLHVSINQMLSDNSSRFNSTVYRLDDANPGYRTHNGAVGDIEQGLIKPFDGFWVQADTEGGAFEFTEQSIRRGSINVDGGGRSTTNESTGSAMFTFTNGQFTSNVYLSFTENGEINLDPADAKQIIPMSPAEHLTSMIHESGKSLSINNLPSDLTTDISFDLDVMMLEPSNDGYETQSEQVSMTWDISNLPEGISLSLVNNGTGQTVNLYGYPSSNVSLPSKGGFSFPENLMDTYPVVGESQFTLSVYSDIASNDDEDMIIPEDITLHNAYPNPFNPSTMISFDIMEIDNVSLNIFDLTGRQVASLINEFMIPGSHQITWNPGLLPSGVYLVELTVGDKSFNQKITYVK